MAETLTHEALAKSLGTVFQVQVATDQTVELRLTEISDLKRSERQEGFAIVFSGPNDAFLGQGTQLMRHEHLGHFELFIVPIGQDEDGYRYEAIFNRFRGPTETAS